MNFKEMQSMLFLYKCRTCQGTGVSEHYGCHACYGLGIDKEMHKFYPMEMAIIEIEEHDRNK